MVEGEDIVISCQLTYRGKWGPRMKCRDEQGVLYASTAVISGWTVTYQLKRRASKRDHRKTFTCAVDFAPHVGGLDPAPGENEATNIPAYDFVYTVGPISFQCA